MLSFEVMGVLSHRLGSYLMGHPVTSIHFARTDAICKECAEDGNIPFYSPLGNPLSICVVTEASIRAQL